MPRGGKTKAERLTQQIIAIIWDLEHIQKLTPPQALKISAAIRGRLDTFDDRIARLHESPVEFSFTEQAESGEGEG